MKKNLSQLIANISSKFSSFFHHDIFLKLLSIFLAFIIWAMVSIFQYPTITKTFVIPAEIDLEGTYAHSAGLDVISSDSLTVTVTLSGDRGRIGSLTEDDLNAYVDLSTVMTAREYNLPVKVAAKDSSYEFEVKNIEPSSVSVTFDEIITKEIPVSPMLENVSVATGYSMGDAVVSPSAVSVKGPKSIVSSITDAYAVVSPNRVLDSSYEFTTDNIILYNNNAIISDDTGLLSVDKTSFTVQIPIFVRKTLPLNVNIVNAPQGFDVEYFRSKLTFSIDAIDIAAPNNSIDELESLTIGTINMREVDMGSRFEFKAENFLPEGYENLTGAESVVVTCPSEGLSKKSLIIMAKDIHFINIPTMYHFTTVASGITVTLVGDEEQISEISTADVTAQIDLIGFNTDEQESMMPVDIIISSYDKVWFTGGNTATPKIAVTADYIGADTVIPE